LREGVAATAAAAATDLTAATAASAPTVTAAATIATVISAATLVVSEVADNASKEEIIDLVQYLSESAIIVETTDKVVVVAQVNMVFCLPELRECTSGWVTPHLLRNNPWRDQGVED
jgi:hypothetical protein